MKLYWKTKDEYDEFYFYGLIGLINGVRTYNESKGVTKSTYFVTCIKNSIKKCLYRKSLQKHNNPYGDDISLHTELSDGFELGDTLKDDKVDIYKSTQFIDDVDTVLKMVDTICTEKEKYVLYRKFGLNGYTESSNREIGESLHVTKDAIRQQLDKILAKLRYFLVTHEGEEYEKNWYILFKSR